MKGFASTEEQRAMWVFSGKEWLSVKTSYGGVKGKKCQGQNITLEKYITLVEWKQENSRINLARVEST